MPLNRSRIRAICFDVDGTLRDTDDQFVARLERSLRFARFMFPRRDPRRFARWLVMRTEAPGSFLMGLPDQVNLDERLERITAKLYRLLLGGTPSHFILVAGIREMLEALRPRYPLAVISVRSQEDTQSFLDQFDLTPYFQAVATAHTCQYTKPYPDPILWAARQMGVDPTECLMVGDTTVDIRAGLAAGAQAAGVLCGFGEKDELERMGADIILSKTPDLATILLEPPENG